MKKRISVCLGTRPEIIKLAPIIHELNKRECFEVSVCATGQHSELAKQTFDAFDIKPDIDFQIMSSSKNISEIVANSLLKLGDYLESYKPDLTVVQGDTASVFAAALASYHRRIPVAHIEAGLRTGNIYSPWPEEGYRSMISQFASLNFAPTELNRTNLLNDGVADEKIFVVGNTVIDSLFYTLHKLEDSQIVSDIPRFNLPVGKKIILVTTHRRENFESGLSNIFQALNELSETFPETHFILPAHYNPIVRKKIQEAGFEKNDSFSIIEPLSYVDFVWLMNKSHHIITDSGGIQEEAPSLGKPVLIVRDTTERPEAVDSGVAELVGTSKDNIVRVSSRLFSDDKYYNNISTKSNPFGDGTSAKKIVDSIVKYI